MGKHILLFTIILSLLPSCTLLRPQKEIEVITKTKIITKDIPPELLKQCRVPEPPNQEIYITLDYPEKEKVLIDYINELLLAIGECTEQLIQIRKWDQENKDGKS